jgi:hypothetical protein
MGVEAWSTTAASNNASPPNGAPEGMAASAVNDVMRQIMADVRSQLQDGQWLNWGHTPTRTDDDTFTVATDLTTTYHAGRRLKVTGSATGYCTIASSSYSAPNTTVNVTMDSGNLPGTLSAVYVAILSGSNQSIPLHSAALITSGSLADARLSSNVPLKDAANTFSASQTLTAASATWVANSTGASPKFQLNNAGTRMGFFVGALTNNDFVNGTTAGDVVVGASAGGIGFTVNDGSTLAARVSSAGNWTINAAGSGDEFTVTGSVVATSFAGDGSGLTALSATALTSGTIPDARFPATLPAASGANLTALNATQLTSGTVPDARFPATLPAASGANLTALNATNISSGTLDNDRLPATINAATDLQINSVPIFASGTFTVTLTGCTTSPTGTATWYRAGNIVTLLLPAISATSNTTSCTFTGLPAAIQPATLAQQLCRIAFADNTTTTSDVSASIAAGSGTITFIKGLLSTTFTSSGTKGVSLASAITYLLT